MKAGCSTSARRVSATTPTMVDHCASALLRSSKVKRFPIGSSLGQYRRAVVSLTIATSGAPARSCWSKNLPFNRGIFITEKNSGVTLSVVSGV